MALARYEGISVDNAGNVLAAPIVEVRLESTNALAALYSDRDGLVAIGNPFTGDADGTFGFHVAGGAYRITVTSGAFSRTKRYVPIGTRAEEDASSTTAVTTGITFNTKALAAVATIDASAVGLRTLGFANAGDKGGALYKKVVSLTSADAGFQSTDGAYWQLAEPLVRPEMVSGTRDTAAINTAIKVANEILAGEVVLTNETYVADEISGQTYCLRLYGNVSLRGEAPWKGPASGIGTGSIINWGSGVANSSTILKWECGTGYNVYHAKIDNVAFMPDGFTPNAAWWLTMSYHASTVITVNAGSGLAFSNCKISNCLIGPARDTGIYWSKTASEGDWASSVLEDCNLFSGVIAGAWLDNCKITGCKFDGVGPDYAMDITQAPGAGNIKIEHNHGWVKTAAIYARIGYGARINHNYFETRTGTFDSQYLYYIHGTSGRVIESEFIGNIAAKLADTTTGMVGLVYIDKTDRLIIKENLLRNDTASAINGFVFSDDNSYPRIGENKIQGVITPSTGSVPIINRPGYTFITPATVKPIGYDVALTPNGAASWALHATESCVVRLTETGEGVINGGVSGGTTTSGTLVATLPTGYIPPRTTIRVGTTATGAAVAFSIQGTDGANPGRITLVGTGNSTYTGLSCRFPVATNF